MNWRQALNFALTTCGAMVLLMGLFVAGPVIETKFFPVYSRFKILSVEPYGAGQSRAVFQFTKYRQCDPQGFAWFTGDQGAAFRQLRVSVEADEQQATRPTGMQITSPYIIDATVEQVKDATFAEIYSRCHPFWTTRSEIYP